MKKIAVYGSLLSGMGNHGVLLRGESKLLSKEVVDLPFGMIAYGYGFPALVPSSMNHNITVEVYEVDDDAYKAVERLEGYPSFYQKHSVNTSVGEAEVYVINRERMFHTQPTGSRVESGDWKAWVTEFRNNVNK